jgi:subtilisin family serine protease
MPGGTPYLAARATVQGVVNHQPQRTLAVHQPRADHREQGQTELVRRPARHRKEPVRPGVVPASPKPRTGQHPADGARTDLAENGYTDADTRTLPVIVQYPATRTPTAVRSAADALPASTPTHTLESIHASAVAVTRSKAGSFWASVRGRAPASGPGAKALAGGISKLWLDRKVTATLDQSVPLIGAPDAWDAGHDGTGAKVAILDTGIDDTHPDLVGKVDQSRSFVPGVDSVKDGHGHGTHVASIITGSGAASGGKYKGVAPGVELVIGKVLDDSGSGDESWVIDGMEWAATSGAKIVSLSLGSGPSDGTDPASQAVNDLTAQTGTLFVIAAGNAGKPGTVASPGTADAALTVAAVSKSDTLAGFSSRGPRLDGGLKPDIAAPGVIITAARAAGTKIGPLVGDYYTVLSGTSMATPHVSGAAAILAQEHPDWKAAQLKAALMSTAKDDGYTVYEQGAGRVDVARADRQRVFATTPNLDFGRTRVDEDTGPVSKQVTYTNLGDKPVTFTLTHTLHTTGGTTQADGALTTDASVTVPPGGTATTTVTLDLGSLPAGTYTGALVAIDTTTGTRLTTPVGLLREPHRFNLTIHTIDRDGKPRTPRAMDVIDVSGEQGLITENVVTGEGSVLVRVAPGTYSVTQLLPWIDDDSRRNIAWLSNPQVTVAADTEITLDARQATQVVLDTPKPSEPLALLYSVAYQRTTVAGARYEGIWDQFGPDRVWAAPTRQVTEGTFRFWIEQKRGAPELTMRVLDVPNLALHPVLVSHGQDGAATTDGHPGFRHFPVGTQNLALVDLGRGGPDDFAGRDLHGKLVLVRSGTVPNPFQGPVCGVDVDVIGRAREAGAAGLVSFPEEGSGCPVPVLTQQQPFTGPLKPTGIPTASVSTKEGLALRALLTSGPVTIRVDSASETPYTYALSPYEEGRISDSQHFTFGERQLAEVDLDLQQTMPGGTWYNDSLFAMKREDVLGLSSDIATPHTGAHRTEYVGPLASDVVYLRIVTSESLDTSHVGPSAYGALRIFDRPVQTRERWLVVPTTPGAPPVSDDVAAVLGDQLPLVRLITFCAICREGNTLLPWFYTTSGTPQAPQNDGLQTTFWAATLHLYKDGTEIPENRIDGVLPTFTMPPEAGTYRLTAHGPTNPALADGGTTDVEWTFSSSQVTEQATRGGYTCVLKLLGLTSGACRAEPILFVGYDLGSTLAADNTVAANRAHQFRVTVSQPQTLTPPHVTDVKVCVSTDDGAHWAPADVRQNLDGSYTINTAYPDYASTSGAVSLKVQAWDVDGNSVTQTSLRAFKLRGVDQHTASQAQ